MAVRHIGIDDWAVRKRYTYGTTMVDLDTHKLVDMIPSRNEDDVARWLARFPNLELISRDGALFYRNAITRSHPDAIQVSDRFHYLKTITEYLREAIMHVLPTHIIMNADAPAVILSPSESPRHNTQPSEAWLRKQKLVAEVRAARSKGQSLTAIGRKYSLNRVTVAKYVAADFEWRPRQPTNLLLNFIPEAQRLAKEGYSPRAIYNQLVAKGYNRAYRTFREYWPQVQKKSMPQEAEHVTRKQFAGLLFKRTQSCAWTPAVQAVLNQYPLVKTILSLFFDFLLLCESYGLEALDHWLDNAAALNDPYVNKACAAIQRDYDAIQNSIIFREYSNGPMEGKNTKTKFVKRQMFGRMSFDVLRIKMLLLESA
ncbi:hypothetical protein EFT87_14680 [Schleiferilactobacillus harbinensis]|nr:hypothetical protein [Schleiferilactobacillus harbinensis]